MNFFCFALGGKRYIDLLQLVQPDYSDDPIILLLLKEMEEFANVREESMIETTHAGHRLYSLAG